MGISTLQSYNGAQIFEIVGISQKVVDEYFTDTPSVLSGIGLNSIGREVLTRLRSAFNQSGNLEVGGEITWNRGGEHHILNPEVVRKLQRACKENDKGSYQEYADLVNLQSEKLATIRGMMNFKNRSSIPLSDVESTENIMKRFRISGMSFGSLSVEAHETLAIAMNRIGAAFNCGEGGEDPDRYYELSGQAHRKSAVKQVASGRFGVTTNYLINCDEIEIKMAQGAKPGEGGHLPGGKVTAEIAKVRHSEPEIDLISPPPHHDIYSIEDLSQLIFDLKNTNSNAKVGVKLVSQIGVGTVAAGVAKAHADKVLISGHDGGTGASPISSMKYVGLPWELGLAEAQQTLLLNNLRSRITLQVDGKICTGRDVIIAALLGAEEYGFATSVLIASGCKMCRRCHLNKCPSGIATQDAKLRRQFSGTTDQVIDYLRFVAEEAREIMAGLGFHTLDEMIGRVDVLEIRDCNKDKIKGCDFSAILYRPELPSRIECRRTAAGKFELDHVLDSQIIADSMEALKKGEQVELELKIKNTDRSFGAMLSGRIVQIFGEHGLPEDTIKIFLKGSAGQSFGAFATRGLTLILEGEANDYLGKGLSGGRIVVVPPSEAIFNPQNNIIAGNTLLYGATSGEAYILGSVGRRFCVRNSGAVAVVEGVGDHGCEYMTGGTVVVLGKTGKNFGAGMSGGTAYILDEEEVFMHKYNKEMVFVEHRLNPKDIKALKNLITNHFKYTNSLKAKEILENWDFFERKILKVSPLKYTQQIKLIV